MHEDDVARSLECRQCGNRIAPEQLGPAVRCPYCHAEQAVDPALLQQVRQYTGQVQQLTQTAHGERRQVAWWGQQSFTQHAVFGGMICGVGGLVLVLVLMGTGVVPERFGFLGPLAMFGGGGLGAVVAYNLARSRAKRRSDSNAVAANEVACPTCGAPNSFRPGQTVESCAYCGGGLVASEQTMDAGVDAAADVARRAAMERYRAERTGMVNAAAMSTRWSRPVLFGRRRWDRFEAAANALAADDGHALLGLPAVAGWLNRYWAGSYPVTDLLSGKASFGAAMRLEGYPVLVFADDGPMSVQAQPKVHLLLAATIPGVSEETSGAPARGGAVDEWLDALRRDAGEPEVQQAGILVRMREDEVTMVQKRPERLAELRPVLDTMVRAAVALDAQPAPSIG